MKNGLDMKGLREVARSYRAISKGAADLEKAFNGPDGWSSGCKYVMTRENPYSGVPARLCKLCPNEKIYGKESIFTKRFLECRLKRCPL